MRRLSLAVVVAPLLAGSSLGAQAIEDLRACGSLRADTVPAVVMIRVSSDPSLRRPQTFGAAFAGAIARQLRLPDALPEQVLRQAGAPRTPGEILIGIRAEYTLRLREGAPPELVRDPGEPPRPSLDASVRAAVWAAADSSGLATLRAQGWTPSEQPLRIVLVTADSARTGAAIVARVTAPRFALDQQARTRRAVAPLYPEALRQQGVEGESVLDFVIGTDGRVLDGSVRVVRTTNLEFVTAAATALRSTTFEPARVQGCAIPMAVRLPFHFSLRPGLAPSRRS